jgi:hypothetical protein
LKPTLLGVLNQWRSVSAKSVMRVLAGASVCSAEETLAPYATVAPAAAGRMSATSGSDAFAHVASGAVNVGSPAPALSALTQALLP